MIHIIHGDDIVSSQNKVSVILKTLKNITVLNGEKVNSQEIDAAFASQDLFVLEKCVVIEKFLKLKKAEMEVLLKILENNDKQITVVLWHNTELSKVALSKFKNAQVESFVLPKLFFTFLDTLSPHSLKKELDVLFRMEGVEAEQVFYALIKRVRLLLYMSLGVSSEETIKMSPWQAGKLREQSSLWKSNSLQKLYAQLFQIEVSMKSGGLVLPLRAELDRVLIQELN